MDNSLYCAQCLKESGCILGTMFMRVGYVTTGYPAGYTTAYGQTYPVAGYYLSGR